MWWKGQYKNGEGELSLSFKWLHGLSRKVVIYPTNPPLYDMFDSFLNFEKQAKFAAVAG